MAISSNRLIGLTEELQIEQSCQVQDLHIGWHNEYQAQHQKDPAGHQHRAPVVTWQRHGITYQYVPGLVFVALLTPPEDGAPPPPPRQVRGRAEQTNDRPFTASRAPRWPDRP